MHTAWGGLTRREWRGRADVFSHCAQELHGGVMTADPYQTGPGFYHLRVPQAVWHHGEAMITTNSETDGRIAPPTAAERRGSSGSGASCSQRLRRVSSAQRAAGSSEGERSAHDRTRRQHAERCASSLRAG